jgi:hypothetical protein
MSIFDDEVRAGMNSYQAAMAKGMPPDQAEAYTHGLDVLGILDYTQLPAVLRQFQQMKQPPAQQLATPNVAQQIQMLANARQGGRGLGAIRSGTMPVVDPMMRGIGAMDAGRMENPRGFNVGGIVAFAGKDNEQLVQSPPIVAANLPKTLPDFSTPENIAKYYGEIYAQGRVPIYQTTESEMEDIEKAEGVGEFAKSLEEEAALLKARRERSLDELMEDKEGLRRQEAADIAGAAAGSRSYLEAVAKGRSTAVQRERDLIKDIRAAKKEQENAELALSKARDQQKKARTDKAFEYATNKVTNAENRLVEANKTISDRDFRLKELDIQNKNNLAVAAFEASRRMGVAMFERDTAMKVAEAEARIKAGQGTSTDYVLGGELAKRIQLETNLRKETDPAKIAAIQKDIEAVNASIKNISETISGTRARSSSEPIDLTQPKPAGGTPAAAPSSVQAQANAILKGD